MTDLMLDTEKEISLLREMLQKKDVELQEQIATRLHMEQELERVRESLHKAQLEMQNLRFTFEAVMRTSHNHDVDDLMKEGVF